MKKIEENIKDDIRQFYIDGLSGSEIAKTFSISETSVRNILSSYPDYEELKNINKKIRNNARIKAKKVCPFNGCNKLIGNSQQYCPIHTTVIKNEEIKNFIKNIKIKEKIKHNDTIFIKYNQVDFFSIKINDCYCLADLEDFNLLCNHSWHFHTGGYIECRVNGKNELIHRLIMKNYYDLESCNLEVDHINLNKLDNRKSNLRLATHCANQMNRIKQSNNTSGYKGIIWDESRKLWRVQFNSNGLRYNIGRFPTIEEAVQRRNDEMSKEHGIYFRE